MADRLIALTYIQTDMGFTRYRPGDTLPADHPQAAAWVESGAAVWRGDDHEPPMRVTAARAAAEPGLPGLAARYSESEIDALVRGGVTPLESAGGTVSVVRGVTTRTKTGSSPDASWRELSTVLIVDDVIPGIRNSLRARFNRTKNTQQTRGAIRSHVIVELENRLAREIITGYEDVTVSALPDDPEVCLVEFAFTVAHGLNQIWLSAHISI